MSDSMPPPESELAPITERVPQLPSASEERMAQLERAVQDYRAAWERERDGRRRAEMALAEVQAKLQGAA